MKLKIETYWSTIAWPMRPPIPIIDPGNAGGNSILVSTTSNEPGRDSTTNIVRTLM